MRVRTGLYPVMAVVAAICQHHAFAAAGGDSVIQWNKNAGDAAMKGMRHSRRRPVPRVTYVRDHAHRHL